MLYLLNKELREIGFKYLGNYSRIHDFCVASGRLVIARSVHIAPSWPFAGGDGGITFDDFSGMTYQVYVLRQSSDYACGSLANRTVPEIFKNQIKKPVYPRRHCIVGAGSKAMPGVTLNEGMAIGAMTLVCKSTEAWAIYAGNPTNKIKDRKKNVFELERQFLSDEVGYGQ